MPCPPSIDWSRAGTWYDENADAFEMNTLALPVPPFLKQFAASLPAGSKLLDAGCGAGRDARWLLDHGFDVSAFDISKEMVAATYANTSGRVQPRQMDFRDYNDAPGSWDGIWALASLLHLPRHEVPSILMRLLNSLTVGGILAFAVKQGSGEKLDAQGRPVSYFECTEITNMVFSAMPTGGRIETEVVTLPDSSGCATAWINVMAFRNRSS